MTELPVKLLSVGFLAGIMGGLLGIGGGIILVPAMISWFAVKQHNAHAISLAVIIPTGIIGGLTYGSHGNIDLTVTLYLIIGSVLGAILGARLATKLPATHLKKIFGIMLLVVGLRMVIG